MEPAERMSVNAANSLLKTLEEPPGNAIIILLTENAGMLLPTIRSRCQLIRFSPLSPENVRMLLERSGMPSEAAGLLAPLSEGSMQHAAELDNDALAARRETLLAQISALDIGRVGTIFDAAEDLAGNRDETLASLDLFLSLARDAVYLQTGSREIVNTAVRPALERFAGRFTLEGALQLLGDIMDTRRAVQRNANNKLALDCLFMKVAEAIT
jgi:DNA polymerase-3 subunit delta'